MILMLTAAVATGCAAFFGTAKLEQVLLRDSSGPKIDQINKQLGVSAITLTAAGVGALLSPTLYALSSAGLIYLATAFTGRRLRSLRERRDVRPALLTTGAVWFFVAQHWFFLSAAGAFVYAATRSLLAEAEQALRPEILDAFGRTTTSSWMRRGELELEVPTSSLRRGDLIVVQAGEVIPVGGVIVEGSARIDQRVLTGELQPLERGPGDAVRALTLMMSGRLVVRVG